ncbi:MAG: ATP-binding protein [Planctomycetaceae bacterium]|nr:ATP-binding protein [Planctomycetaceae bacterium]
MSDAFDLRQTSTDWLWTKEFSFDSSMDAAHSFIDEIMAQLESAGWGMKEAFAANMTFEEALINAVQHGNHSDLEKQVHVICRLNGKLVYARIEDEGNGFDPDSVPDPTKEDNLLMASGRGVLLIRQFTSWSKWNDVGNVLEFEIEKPG